MRTSNHSIAMDGLSISELELFEKDTSKLIIVMMDTLIKLQYCVRILLSSISTLLIIGMFFI